MRYLIFALPLLLIISCNDTDENDAINGCPEIEFDNSIALEIGDSVCLPDDRMITLLEVEDQYCPCFVACDWGGQLLIKFILTDSEGVESSAQLSISDAIGFENLYDDITTSNLTYIYNGETNNLPPCDGIFNQNNITILLTLSN